MIGKPEWFKYRIFGWGLAPKTWQGYTYVLGIVGIIGIILSLGIPESIKPWIMGSVIFLVVLDTIHIMFQLPKVSDERENYHQLLIERNCSFAAIASLIGVMLFQTYQNREIMDTVAMPFDASIIIVLGAMLVAKIVTTLYVKYRK